MNSVFMAYFEHLAKLSSIANKQTLFLAHILYRMEYDESAKQFVATLTKYDKKSILKSIGCESKSPLNLAGQYILKLTDSGLIKSIGDGAYIIDPMSYGSYKYIPKHIRIKGSKIYEHRVFSDDVNGVIESYIVTEDGEKIEL